MCKNMSLIRIAENNNFIIDYDKEKGMYRVSFFENGHWQDEIWFDAYENNELKVNLTKDELEMIDTGLFVACNECQLPDKGEEGYEEVILLRKKLGIYTEE